MKSMVQFISQVRLELSRVEWPSYTEFVGSTLVVLFLMAVFAIYIGFVDKAVLGLARHIYEYASY